MFWISVWTLFMTVAILPETVKFILQTFQINRVMDLLMILAFMVLSIVTFRNYSENRQLRKKVYEFIKNDAIKQSTSGKKSSQNPRLR
jgi:hypothetical protein